MIYDIVVSLQKISNSIEYICKRLIKHFGRRSRVGWKGILMRIFVWKIQFFQYGVNTGATPKMLYQSFTDIFNRVADFL